MAPRPRRLLIALQPLHSGVPHHVLALVRSLPPGEFDVTVSCPRGSVAWTALERASSIRLRPLTRHRRPHPADLLSLLSLLRLVGRADVVHAHSSKAGFLVRLAAVLRRRAGRCVFTPHGWSFWAARGLEARLYRWLERLAVAWCRTIVTLSVSERDAGLAVGIGRPERYRVIPNGVELERFGRAREPVPGRIIWLGRLAPPKRPDLALRALALVRRKVPAAHLHVVGEGVQRDELEALSGELELGDAVRFLGARDDVPDLLAAAECLLLASDYEGCPLAVLEALAAGVPVVATSVGGIPEILDHDRTGLLVEPGSPSSLAAALIELISSPGRAAELGLAGRRIAADRFSIERMAADVVALYREIDTGSN